MSFLHRYVSGLNVSPSSVALYGELWPWSERLTSVITIAVHWQQALTTKRAPLLHSSDVWTFNVQKILDVTWLAVGTETVPPARDTERCNQRSLHTFLPFQVYFVLNYNRVLFTFFSFKTNFTCGNKMPTRCNRSFYCRSYCLLNMFRAPLCPSSGAQEYCTARNITGSNHCTILLSSWWWA